jgi:hypothetical protein
VVAVIWLRYLPHLAVGVALAGSVYWVSQQRYAAGYLAGDQAGYKRGAYDAHRENDAQMLRLMADSRAAASEALRAREQQARDNERRYEAENAAVRDRYSGRAADLQRVIDRLRAVPARNPVCASAGSPGLPDPGAAETVDAAPAGLLSPPRREAFARLGSDADDIAAEHAQCAVYIDAVKRARGKTNAKPG